MKYLVKEEIEIVQEFVFAVNCRFRGYHFQIILGCSDQFIVIGQAR